MYRITRTIVRGQFANDQCFTVWLAANAPNGVVFVKTANDPLNTGGPNDKRYYLWLQSLPVTMPKCPNSDPDLVTTNNGKNGWDTKAEAQNVLNYELGQSKVLAENIKAQNEAAVSPSNIAAGVAKDIAKDVDAASKSILSSPVTWVVGTVGAGVLLYKILK